MSRELAAVKRLVAPSFEPVSATKGSYPHIPQGALRPAAAALKRWPPRAGAPTTSCRRLPRGRGMMHLSCGAPGRGAERALPSADAQNLTTPERVAAPFVAPLGNASEGRTPVSQHPQISPVDPRPRSGATRRRGRVNANPAHWSTAAIAEMAIAVALAAALGLVKLFVMPQGGSVSLEMLPILFIAVRRGLVPGDHRGRRLRLRAAPAARRLPRAARPGRCSTTRWRSARSASRRSCRCRSRRSA